LLERTLLFILSMWSFESRTRPIRMFSIESDILSFIFLDYFISLRLFPFTYLLRRGETLNKQHMVKVVQHLFGKDGDGKWSTNLSWPNPRRVNDRI